MCRPGGLSLRTHSLTVSVASLLLLLLSGFLADLILQQSSGQSSALRGETLKFFPQWTATVSSMEGALLFRACRTKKTWPVSFPQEELKKRLTPMQYHVTQERGTESAFTGGFTHHKDEGTYTCVVCGASLFTSNTKFDSGSGWPSFFDLVKEDAIDVSDDFSYGMHRVETTCSQCGAHLGHLFDDGPKPTGKRYCINSASLGFQPKDTPSSSGSAAEGGAASTEGKTEL